jgi:hypothetical protein
MGNEVEIDLTVCLDIQVELDVKIEVMARFSQPRAPITPPVITCPIGVTFPPQCPFFPPVPSCNCTGLLNASNSSVIVTFTPPGGTTTTEDGELDTAAAICPNCQGLDQSTLYVNFIPEYPYSIASGFEFTAPGANFDPTSFSCSFVSPTTTLTVGGTGYFTNEGVTTLVNFSLTLTQVASTTGGTCSYSLILTTLLGVPITSLFNIVVTPCDSAHFFIDSCN